MGVIHFLIDNNLKNNNLINNNLVTRLILVFGLKIYLIIKMVGFHNLIVKKISYG